MLSKNGRRHALQQLESLHVNFKRSVEAGEPIDIPLLMNTALSIVFRCVVLAGGSDVIKKFQDLEAAVALRANEQQPSPEKESEESKKELSSDIIVLPSSKGH